MQTLPPLRPTLTDGLAFRVLDFAGVVTRLSQGGYPDGRQS